MVVTKMGEDSGRDEVINLSASQLHMDINSGPQEEELGTITVVSSDTGGSDVFKLLLVQQREFHEQLDELQRLLALQLGCTGETGLEDALTACILGGNVGWQKPKEDLPLAATKALEEAFSLKDSVTKIEARDLGNVLGISSGQVKEFFVSQRGHMRAWLRSMQSGPVKGRLKQGPQWAPQSGQGGAGGEKVRNELQPVGNVPTRAKPDLSAVKKPGGTEILPLAASVGHQTPALVENGHAPASCDCTTSGCLLGGNMQADAVAGQAVPSHTQRMHMEMVVEPPKGSLVESGLQTERKPDGVWDVDGGKATVTSEIGLAHKKVPQAFEVGSRFATEADVDAPAHISVRSASEAALAASKGALPLEPFQPKDKPHGLSIDLNKPPDETVDDMVELRGSDSGAPVPQSNGVRACDGSRSGVAALFLGAVEKRAGAPRRVRPEAMNLQGRVSQVVGTPEEVGRVGEDKAARLVRVMRGESSVAGRLQILETLAKQRKRLLDARLLDGAGLAVLHCWLVDAVGEEQTSLLRTLLQVLSLLPLRLTGPPQVASLARSVLQLRRYFVPDVARLAQQVVGAWRRGTVPGLGRGEGQPHQGGSGSALPPPTLGGASPHMKAPALTARKREILPLPPLRASPPAALLAPAVSPAPSPVSSVPPGLRSSPALAETSSDASPKRAGSPLGPTVRKQARIDEGPPSPGDRRKGGGPKAGRFAELLQRGRRRDSGEAQVAALLHGAMAVGVTSDEAEKKPLSSDDIRKAKAREQLIRQMQRRNGTLGKSADSTPAGEGGGARVGERRGTGRLARDGGTVGANGSGQTELACHEPLGLDAQSAQRQGAGSACVLGSPQRNGGTLGSAVATPLSRGALDRIAGVSPRADATDLASSPISLPPIDVTAISALAEVLQMGSSTLPPPPLAATAEAPQETETRESSRGRPSNPLLAQLVAQVERQKARERERIARGGPQAAATAEAQQSWALLQQLEAQVAALVAQEARQAVQQKSSEAGQSGGRTRAVALMEDRAIPWQTPPVVPLDPAWNVPAGSNSEEALRLTARDAATRPAQYPTPGLIPAQPHPPPVVEPDADDRATPEITMLDRKQQQQQEQQPLPDDDEDAEYQAAVAEAYGMGGGGALRGGASADVSSMQGQRGRVSASASPHLHPYPAFVPAPTPAALHHAATGETVDHWRHAPGMRPWGGPPPTFPPQDHFHAPFNHGSSPPQFGHPSGDRSWPRGPQYPLGRTPPDRPQRDHMGNRPPSQQYGARPSGSGWSRW